jgi:extracellular factor (EF) 3-hydroxypalmitic acid methyl ester biosynthesis protein
MSPTNTSTAKVRIFAQELLHKLQKLETIGESDQVYAQVAAAIDECLHQLRSLDLWGRDNQLPSSELWNVAGHVLVRGWLQNRARAKPRGYAGDYEILGRMYENRLCDDPLGRMFDRYFQEQPAPQAVRNRMKMMVQWIVERAGSGPAQTAKGHDLPLRVAVVGSAFGLELRDALLQIDEPRRERFRVTLLDLDPDAIEFARAQLAPLLLPQHLTAISTNFFRLPQRPQTAAALDGSDLLFCPGLFDYLDDATAAAMFRYFYERLAPGGRLTVFQFAPHDPTRAYMEWVANWYLTYRTEAELRRVVEQAGLPQAETVFGAEHEGVDLFVAITRN